MPPHPPSRHVRFAHFYYNCSPSIVIKCTLESPFQNLRFGYASGVCSKRFITHFLFLKMKLNARHATANTMPTVARMKKMIVREGSTDTSFSSGAPS